MHIHRAIRSHCVFAIIAALAFAAPTQAQDAARPGMARAASPRKSDLAHAIIGTWNVTGYSQVEMDTNTATYPFGKVPLGYVQFSPGGHLAVFITAGKRVMRKAPFSTADESAIFRDLATAYVGTYRIEGDKAVIHEITALRPDAPPDQTRLLELQGNKLTMKNPPNMGRTGKRIIAVVTAERVE
jgi:hypothetical protein